MNSQKPIGNSTRQVDSKRNRKKSVAIIAVMFAVIFGIIILSVVAIALISKQNEVQPNKTGSLIFYEADYDYNIMRDQDYLDLDRQIYFENTVDGMTVTFTDDTLEDLPKDQKAHLLHIYEFIRCAIYGRTDELNALFSQEYVDAGGKLKMDFTMQQLYNIKITYVEMSSEIVDGNTYVSYDYWLEYMIRKNNGTFRSDMGSDCVRKEYIRVTDRAGTMGIDVLAPYTTQNQVHQAIDTGKIMTITAVTLGVIALGWFTIALIVKKK